MQRDQRCQTFLELASMDIKIPVDPLDQVSILCESGLEITDDILSNYGIDGRLYLEGEKLEVIKSKAKAVVGKTRSAINRLKNAAKRLYHYFKSGVAKGLEKVENSKTAAKIKIKADGATIASKAKELHEYGKKLNKSLKDFWHSSVPDKIVYIQGKIPATSLRQYVEYKGNALISKVFIKKIMISYVNTFIGQDYNCITEFTEEMEKKIETLDESGIYAGDKLIQKALNYINAIQTEFKALYLLGNNAMSEEGAKSLNKAAEKANSSTSDSKVVQQKNNIINRAAKTVQKVSDDNATAVAKYKEYRRKKDLLIDEEKAKKAHKKFEKGGGKALSKSDVKALKREEERKKPKTGPKNTLKGRYISVLV